MDTQYAFLPRGALDQLLDALRKAGFNRLVGPIARDGAIVYDTLTSAAQLPHGYRDEQAPGRYRLHQADSGRCFSWANGTQTLKPLTFAPQEVLWHCERDAEGCLRFKNPTVNHSPTAVIGVRACDLAALRLQERHFLGGRFHDPHYGARRESLFLLAVHCTHPAKTCFCASTGDGPKAHGGFDIGLSELDEGFILEAGSLRGGEIIRTLALDDATERQRAVAKTAIEAAALQQSRSLPSQNLREALYARLEDRHWDKVGMRCLSCGNCTAVCPTCFCHAEHSVPTLDGTQTTHQRQWDSCFTAVHSYMGHFLVREETRLRYRQWLSHKLANWHDQYGRSGCVGCGRCITWCPSGIDLTAEVAALTRQETSHV